MSGDVMQRDLVIIGGGAAGLAAATSAHDAGIRDILVIERDDAPGGILRQCIHNGFGLHRYKEELTGPEYALREYAAVVDCGIEVSFNTMVVDLLPDRTVVAVSPERGLMRIEARAVILAMGSRERTRGMLGIAGTRPAGVYTAGTAQQMINLRGLLPGREIVMLGSGDIGLIVARRLAYEGANVKMVLNRSHFSGGLKRNIVQCLDDYGIPLRLSHTITAIHGRTRVEAVEVSRVDPATKLPVPGTTELVECDTVLLSVGLMPENELTREAGIVIDRASGGALVDETLETSMPGVFSAGNVLHIHDLVDFVSEEGDRAGRAAAEYLLERAACNASPAQGGPADSTCAGDAFQASRLDDDCIHVEPGDGVSYVVPQRVRAGATGQLVFRFRCRDIYRTAQIHVEADGVEVKVFKRRVMLPAEMETLKLDASLLDGVRTLRIWLTADEVGAAPAASDDGPAMEGDAGVHDLDADVREITCISCPMGCALTVTLEDGKVTAVKGATCPRGETYAHAELEDPRRVVTSLVDVAGSSLPASVRTESPIPKRLIPDVIVALRQVTLALPVRCGEVVLEDVCGSGVDVIATKDVG